MKVKEKENFAEIPDGFRAVTVGSGAPGVDLKRGNPSTLVQYRDRYFLVDCGYGTCRTLTELGLGISRIRNVLFTHQHEDHNADFGHFLVAGWYDVKNGRKSINIVGPQVQLLYEDTYEIFEDDIKGRIDVGARQGAGVTAEGISENVHIHDIGSSEYSLELEGIRIDMHQVLHGNMLSYAYRFSAGGGSVVVTGDLAYTEDLADFCRDADILVIDAMTMTGYFSKFTEEMIERSMGGTHMTQRQMGALLADCRAKNVILTHIGGEFIDFDATVKYFESAGYEGKVYGACDGFSLEL